MHRHLDIAVVLLVILAAHLAWSQAPSKPESTRESLKTEDLAAVKKIRETWVQEFNAGHPDKVAALYADEAVLMRKNGTVHNRESIQADLDRSINVARGRKYIVHSLRTEGSGNIVYDTGMYDEDFPHHVAEGNYLMVIEKIGGEWKIVAHAAVPNPRVQ
jgi:ketosteroid isomerase-like protein